MFTARVPDKRVVGGLQGHISRSLKHLELHVGFNPSTRDRTLRIKSLGLYRDSFAYLLQVLPGLGHSRAAKGT